MRGDHAQGANKLGKVDVANGPFQPLLDLLTPQESLPRKDEGVDELEQSPPMLDFTSQAFHGGAVEAIGPDRAHVGAHAASDDCVHLDSVFLQDLNDADMGEAASSAG